MSLSQREGRKSVAPVDFDPDALGVALRDECPEISFVLLLGSGRDGHIPTGADLDLAVSLDSALTFDLVDRITAIAQRFAPGVEIDIGRFDKAEPVYRFETLKGRLLFARDQERYLGAFSLACREYESQMMDYRRQARYRLQRQGEVASL